MDVDNILTWVSGVGMYEEKCMVSILYLSACRVSELCLVRKRDVVIDGSVLRLSLVTKKRRGKYKDEIRTISISINEDTKKFVDAIKNYLIMVNYKPEDMMLFNGERSARDKIKNHTGHAPHCFRHSRLTHLARRGFTEFELQKFVNWGTTNVAKEYVHLNSLHITNRLEEVGI